MKNCTLPGIVLIVLTLWSCSGKSTTGNETDTQKIPVIFDTDANNELDDQHALAYLLMNGEVFNVLGVTVNKTFGGGDIGDQYAEAERVMRMCDRFPGIPLYKGANGSFKEILPEIDSNKFDGSDAVNFIIAHANRFSPENKLSLVMVGKLTNAALAFAKDSTIISNIKIVWLGSNYPDPGEYNLENDTVAMNYILKTNVEFEMVTVRYGKSGGTDAVRVTPSEIKENMAGCGPHVKDSVVGRHGKAFNCFGDYSINLFEHVELYGNPPSRALFDMAAVAIVKNPSLATPVTIPRPIMTNNQWVSQGKKDSVIFWENFNHDEIVKDFFKVMKNYKLVDLPIAGLE